MGESSIGRVLRSYAEICDTLNRGFINILFFGTVIFAAYLLLKNPDNIGYLLAYGVFAAALLMGKAAIDERLKNKYLFRTHIYLNRGGWKKEANKAFEISRWEIFFALAENWYKNLRRDHDKTKEKR